MKLVSHVKINAVTFLIFTFFSLFYFKESAGGQTNCPNLDFSSGDFSNWEGYYGHFDNPTENVGFITTGLNPRHLIIKAPGTRDHNTCDGLITVPPGESYSARLGNDGIQGEAEQLRYTMHVTTENNLFIYKYAIVLQQPWHEPSHQPSFTVEVMNQDGIVFDTICGRYSVTSQSTLPGWRSCDLRLVVWKDWTTVGLDLSPYIGQTVTIVFTTKDCKDLGHYGYAYISASCAKLEMSINYCPQSSGASVTAPPGFTYAWSTGATTRTIIVDNLREDIDYRCLLTAENGCQVTLVTKIRPTRITPDFNSSVACRGDTAFFSDASTITQNSIVNRKWDFGDHTPTLMDVKNPVHQYRNPGTYPVKLIAYSSDGCSDSIVKTVIINTALYPSVTGQELVCAGASGIKYTTEPGYSTYTWTVSQGGTITSGVATNSITVQWSIEGLQTVSVIYSDADNCKSLGSGVLNVIVKPALIPSINGPLFVCAGSSGITYTTEAGMSGYNWTVSPGGQITSGVSTNSITVTWNTPGSQKVSVNYTNSYGCSVSSPSVEMIAVHSPPVPAIRGPSTVCRGSAGVTYSTETGMNAYTWRVSNGGTITSGAATNEITVAWLNAGEQTVSVNYLNENGCSSSDPSAMNVEVNPIPFPTITGEDFPCAHAEVTYVTEPGMREYAWSVSAGGIITSGGTNNDHAVTVLWNTAGEQSVSVSYANVSGCFPASASVKKITVRPETIPSINGPLFVCASSSGITYTTEAGMSGYIWTVSPGGQITSGVSTNSITVTWNTPGTQKVSVGYTNSYGCSASSPAVEMIAVHSTPVPAIRGPSTVCRGSAGVTYSTETGMNAYTWRVSNGGAITSGAATNEITVAWLNAGEQTVSVNYLNEDGCSASDPSAMNVEVNPIPSPTITGEDFPCAHAEVTYVTEPGMREYAWSVSPGSIISSGGTNNDHAVTILWNTAGEQSVSVSYANVSGCFPASASVKKITVRPETIPSINGPLSVCAGSPGITYTTEAGMSGYNWTVSPGGQITSGDLSNSITVTWNTPGTQKVSVGYTNSYGCSVSSPAVEMIAVHSPPVPAIRGPSTVCRGSAGVTYSTETGMNAYTWRVSNGGTITSGAATNEITVAWLNAGEQTVSVNYLNENGCSSSDPSAMNVEVNPIPFPTITGEDFPCAHAEVTYVTEPGMREYAWSVSAGGIITSGGTNNDHAVTVLWNTAGEQSVSVSYANVSGCFPASASVKKITVRPETIPSINGPLFVCASSSGITYTTEAGMSGYIWTVSPGGQITSGVSTNSITVTWNTPGTQKVSVGYTNSYGCSASSPAVEMIAVHSTPVPAIRGPSTVCRGSAGVTYTTETGMNAYTWRVSNGGAITSGAATNEITVAWLNAGEQTVSVNYLNEDGCSASDPSAMNVEVNPIPSPTITGEDFPCAHAEVTYVTEPGMREYAWSVSPGSIISSGGTNNDHAVTILWNTAGEQSVSVSYANVSGCFPASASVKKITVRPETIPSINGPLSVCAGSPGITYTTEAGMSGYNWTVSPGGQITSGDLSNSITVTWNTPGTQKVSVGYTNSYGCSVSSPAVEMIAVHSPPVPAIRGPSTVCRGSAGVTYSTETGMNAYTWRVSNGGTITSGAATNEITVAWLNAGEQTVSVNYLNENGCSSSDPSAMNVEVNPIPFPTITGEDFPCAHAEVTYVTEPGMREYAWSVSAGGIITSGGTNNDHAVTVLWNTAGEQSVSVSYANVSGCFPASASVKKITVRPETIPSINGPLFVCASSSGITYTTEAGMSGYIWTVSPGGQITSGVSTNSITVTWNTPGTQKVSVGYTNSYGCSASSPAVEMIAVHSTPVPAIRGPSTVCRGSAGVTYSTETGMNAYTWRVSNGGAITSGAATNEITVAWLNAGEQTVSVNYLNEDGCSASDPSAMNVEVNPIPSPTITGEDFPCAHAEVTYVTEPGMREYAWSVSPGSIISSGGTNNDHAVTILWNTAGEQSVSVSYANVSGCFPASASVKKITVRPETIPSINGPLSVCAGSPGITYTTEAGMSGYNWTVSPGGQITSGDLSNSITVTWNTPGTQKVSVGYTNSYGCSVSSPAVEMIAVHSPPVPAIRGPSTVCRGSAGVTYSTETGMNAYTWRVSNGGTITSGAATNEITVAWLNAGEQTVSVNYLNENGCSSSDPSAMNVEVNPIPFPTITGEDFPCAHAEVTYVTEPGMREYAWSVSAGGIITSGGTNNDHAVTVLWNTAGEQSVSVSYANVSGCFPASASVKKITVRPETIPSINGPLSVCAGSSGITYTTEAGMSGYNWTVSPGGQITSGVSTNSITVTWNTPGTQKVSVGYTNSYGCSASSPAVEMIAVHSTPVPAIRGPSTVCRGSAGVTYSTETGMNAYTWRVSNGGAITSGAATNEITVAWLNAGEQTVSVNYSVAGQCFAESATAKEVIVQPLPLPVIKGPVSVCAGSTELIYTTEAGMTGYIWKISSGGVITSGVGTNTIVVTWTTPGDQNLSINYVNEYGCSISSAIILDVNVKPLLIPTITAKASPGIGESLTYKTEQSMNSYEWIISPGGNITSGNGNNSVTVEWIAAGTQTVSVRYVDQNGCNTSVSNELNVEVNIPPITVNEGISPNGDGLNDKLIFNGLKYYPGSKLFIFSRSGQVIYSSNDYQNDWDGKFIHIGSQTSVNVIGGIYFYILKLGGTNHTIKGFVFVAY